MKDTIILVLIISVVLYLLQPVPYCKDMLPTIDEEQPSSAIYQPSKMQNLFETVSTAPILIRTSGDSMYPTIKTNQLCLCVKKPSYDIGDMTIFFFPLGNDQYHGILHRIINIDGDTIIAQGDNNLEPDPPFNKQYILCHVPEIRRIDLLMERFI
jgi:hypothetical protein